MRKLRSILSGEGGVTLVELMVVVAIVALLAVAFLAAFRTARAHAVDGRAIEFLDQLRRAMALYSARFGSYPVPSGIVNNQANTGQAAYEALAQELRRVESGFPTDLTDPSVNLTNFTYFPMASGTLTAADTFTITAQAINGTGNVLCADPNKVVDLGSSNAQPAQPGVRCQ